MIKYLSIRNFAIIESLEVEFGEGLNIITGETGAGKSIIVEAINTGLGERASRDMVRSGEKKAVIEVEFNFKPLMRSLSEENKSIVKSLLQEEGIPEEDTLIMRRELYAGGRSRAFVNDVPLSLTNYKSLGDVFVDIHGQHEHQSLLNEENHLRFLDSFGNYPDLLEEINTLFRSMEEKKRELNSLKEEKNSYSRKRELFEFQLKELEDAGEDIEKYAELQAEYARLRHAEVLQSAANRITEELYQSEQSVYEHIQELAGLLKGLSEKDERLRPTLERLEAVAYEIQDMGQYFSQYSSDIVFSPALFEDVQNRIFAVERLIRKHGGSLEALLQSREEIREFLDTFEDYEKRVNRLKSEYEKTRNRYTQLARQLHERRKSTAKSFAGAIEKSLSNLGFQQSIFSIDLELTQGNDESINIDGKEVVATNLGVDRVSFLISTNPGEEPRPLAKIASGGETSRIMLGMKSVMAGRKSIPIIIFDEIDSGISGKVAAVVGQKLNEISAFHQIICITHLPQIASNGRHHYSVTKSVKDGRTVTRIQKLEGEERVLSLAALLGGKRVNLSSIEHARQLLKESQSVGKDRY